MDAFRLLTVVNHHLTRLVSCFGAQILELFKAIDERFAARVHIALAEQLKGPC